MPGLDILYIWGIKTKKKRKRGERERKEEKGIEKKKRGEWERYWKKKEKNLLPLQKFDESGCIRFGDEVMPCKQQRAHTVGRESPSSCPIFPR